MAETVQTAWNQRTFNEIYSSLDLFKADYGTTFPKIITDDSVLLTYYLLVGKYGNTPIANSDETQFKIKLWGLIWEYGPTWEKKCNIQSKLRSLTEDDILSGLTSKSESGVDSTSSGDTLNNEASNPGEIKTDLSELNYIDSQSTGKSSFTNKQKQTSSNSSTRGKLESYTDYIKLIKDDFTESYINKFKCLFKSIVYPINPILYEETDEDE